MRLPCALTICLLLAAWPGRAQLPETNLGPLALAAFVEGDGEALAKLRQAGIPAIRALEQLFQWRYEVTDEQVAGWLADLANADHRAAARSRLSLLPFGYLPRLEEHLAKATDEAVKAALQDAIGKLKSGHVAEPKVINLLVELYTDQTPMLFDASWAWLLEDPLHPAALRYFALTPFSVLWERFEKIAPPLRLRFLLARWYVRPDTQTERELRAYTADEIVAPATATYWPVLLEPLQKDGELGYLTLAHSLSEATVNRPLRLAVRPRDYGRDTPMGPWLELRTWYRWTYLFEIRPAQGNRDAVVYAENLPQMLGKPYWPDESAVRHLLAYAPPAAATPTVTAVRGLPATAMLPIYGLTADEVAKWQKGIVYNWARDIMPKAIRDRLQFLPNDFPAPPRLPPDW